MSRPRTLPLLAVLPLVAAACTSPTHYQLVAQADPVRYLVTGTPPEGWSATRYDDSAWSTALAPVGPLSPGADGAMPSLLSRRRFDVGPRASAYRQLTVQHGGQPPAEAYLNGTKVDASGGLLDVPTSLLTPSANVLALLYRPSPGAAIDLQVAIDGAPDPTAAAGRVVRGPWLVSPKPDGITIVWETDVPLASQAVVDGRIIDGGAGTHHEAQVTGLEPSRSYPYQVQANGQAGEALSFQTAARPGERLRFVVFGDNRSDGDAHRRVASAIEAEGPDFLFNTGDMVDSSIESEWQSYFDIEYALLSRVPLFPSIGNHDEQGGLRRYMELFPVSGGRTYYGADYGDVHVASLDSNSDLGAQARWLDEDLTQARARGARHLFVIMHHGPYSSATGILAHGSNAQAQALVVPVCRAHAVDALFAGHDHIYERGQSGQDFRYFVTGGGGAPLRTPGRLAETRATASRFHYLVVDVVGPQVRITAKDPNGETFDELALGSSG